MTLATLATTLSNQLDRMVQNRTDLAGTYDISLEVTLDQVPNVSDAAPPGASASLLRDRPSLFTALPEQLGLKLEAVHAAVEVVVIDHIERPTKD